jgi:cobalt-zinc-cadmium efflux system protein
MKSAENDSGNQSQAEIDDTGAPGHADFPHADAPQAPTAAPQAHAHAHARQAPSAAPQTHAHTGHDHGVRPDADVRYLRIALGLILAFMVGEIVVAVLSDSLALIADAGHMLTDAGAIVAALWTLHLAGRPATTDMTYGYRRAEVLSAALNGITLVAVGAVILVEAVHRLVHPAAVHGTALVIVAAVGVVVNLAATVAIGRANRARMDIAGAFAHLVTDVYAFVGTLVAGIVILTTGFTRADSIASLIVVALMARAAWPLLRVAGRILLEGAPEGVDLDSVRRHILELPGVAAVHDLHAWVVTSDLPAVSAHVVISDDCFASGASARLLDMLQSCLAGHFDVGHSTFQLEAAGHTDHEPAFHD